MKYIIAAAAVSVALSTSSHAQLTTDYDDGAAQFWASLAESTNNADDFVMFSWLADSAELKATDEAVQNALDVSDKVNADDIPNTPNIEIEEATITAVKEGTGAATVNTDHGFEGTYTELDLEAGEVPEEMANWYGHHTLYDSSTVVGKIKLNKDRVKSGITTNIDYNYGDTIYVVDQKADPDNWRGEGIYLVYQFEQGIHPNDFVGDTAWSNTSVCTYMTCANGKAYSIQTNSYYNYGEDSYNAKYYDLTKEELLESIANNPVEHAIQWNFWNTDNTFVISRNGNVIADATHHGIWQSDDLDEMYEIIEEIAEEAYEAGFEDGYSEGYSDGYSDGFADGVNSVKDQLQ